MQWRSSATLRRVPSDDHVRGLRPQQPLHVPAEAFVKRIVFVLFLGLARVLGGKSVRGLEHVRDGRQRIYFANHTSHVDYLLIWAALPKGARKRTRPVAAREYWERGTIRRFFACRVFDAVLVDRNEGRLQRAVVARLASGLGTDNSLVLFPEGTRGSGEALGPFRSGLYHLCRERPGVELIPVRIEQANRILPKGAFVPVPRAARVTFGRPIRLLEDEPKDRFLERARAALEALH